MIFLLFPLLALIVFSPGITNEIHWDTINILKDTPIITGNNSLFNYWIPSNFTRSWPLSYSFIWILHLLFGSKYVFFKIFTLIIHGLNGALIYKILKPKNHLLAIFISFAFLFHPMQVETAIWIIQLNSLLSFMFLLLTMKELDKAPGRRNYELIVLFFFLSLAAKIQTVLFFFPIIYYVLKDRLLTQRDKTKYILVLGLIGLYFGSQSYRGINFIQLEKYQRENFFKKRRAPSSNPPQIAPPVYTQQGRFEQAQVVLKTFQFYFIKAVIPYPLLSFYPKETINIYRSLARLIALFAFLFVIIKIPDRLIRKNIIKALICYTLLWIPISGLFYITFMKFSFVADHYGYMLMPFIFYIIYMTLVGHQKTLKRIISFWRPHYMAYPMAIMLLLTIFQAKRFGSQYDLYDFNYKIDKNNPYVLILGLQRANYHQDEEKIRKYLDILFKLKRKN